MQGNYIPTNNTPVPVNAYPCTLGVNERWTYVNGQLQGNGSSSSGSTCLGESTGGTVVLQTCNNSISQFWIIESGAVMNGSSAKCLDSSG
jgi:hypothetical protein